MSAAIGLAVAKAGGWLLGAAKSLLGLVLKYPLAAALIAALIALAWVNWRANAQIEARDQKLEQAAAQIRLDAQRITERTKERDQATGHIGTARNTVKALQAELAKRDREDAERQKRSTDQLQKALAARRDAEAVAARAMQQLENAARRKPSCAALLAMDVKKECGL